MALPTTAPVVPCTLSKPLLAEGTVGSITSAVLSMDRDLVWTETGETIYKDAVTLPISSEGTLSFDVIPVDVTGMKDATGNPIQDWTYRLRVTLSLAGGVSRTVDYDFQPLTADTLVDLDLVPQIGAVSLPPVIP